MGGSPPSTLNLSTGRLTASWSASGAPINVAGRVRGIETMAAPPSDVFLFVIGAAVSGLNALTTTNI
jgi:hypothetical protein